MAARITRTLYTLKWNMRFPIKILLLALTVTCAGFAYASHVWRSHSRIAAAESLAIEERQLDIEVTTKCTLPGWINAVLPPSVSRQFDHVVGIYVPLDDIAMVDPEGIKAYHCCEYVREIQIVNETLPEATLDALLAFPRLQRITVLPHIHPYHGPDSINLSRYKTNGIEIEIRN